MILILLTMIGAVILLMLLRRVISPRSPARNLLSEKSQLIQQIQTRGEASDNLKRKLISMLEGDEQAAEKLVAKKRFGKEGRYSENYYWWLAIQELEHQKSSRPPQ